MDLMLAGRLLAACCVIALVLFALQAVSREVARRSARATRGGRIVAVLETTALPSGASLHVVRVAERYLLVGRSAAQLTTLCDIPAEHVAAAHAAPRGPANSGATVVRRLWRACRTPR